VSGGVATVAERLVTQRAAIRLLTSVSTFVPRRVAAPAEALFARVAAVRLLARVGPLVGDRRARVAEPLGAERAPVRLNTRMDALVRGDVAELIEALLAVRAPKRLLASVGPWRRKHPKYRIVRTQSAVWSPGEAGAHPHAAHSGGVVHLRA